MGEDVAKKGLCVCVCVYVSVRRKKGSLLYFETNPHPSFATLASQWWKSIQRLQSYHVILHFVSGFVLIFFHVLLALSKTS
jgi:hypothetical protein